MKNTFGIEVGDTVRFVCNKSDEDGFQTNKIMRVTGKCFMIEHDNNINSKDYPTFHVRRNCYFDIPKCCLHLIMNNIGTKSILGNKAALISSLSLLITLVSLALVYG